MKRNNSNSEQYLMVKLPTVLYNSLNAACIIRNVPEEVIIIEALHYQLNNTLGGDASCDTSLDELLKEYY